MKFCKFCYSILLPCLLALGGKSDPGKDQRAHVWVAEIRGGPAAAQRVAESHGLVYEGKIPYLRDKFVFRMPDRSNIVAGYPPLRRRRMTRSAPSERRRQLDRRLSEHPEVSWLSYQTEAKRTKRDLLEWQQVPGSRQFPSDWLFSSLGVAPQRHFSPQSVATDAGISESAESAFIDPFWPRQWYLHDTRSSPEQPRLDMGVLAAWRRNVTGRGIVVAVVDDGLEMDHPDLSPNVDPVASYDYVDGDRNPRPVYYNFVEQRKNIRTGAWHGTRCAGEIAMLANNSFCGVGVAFNARVGGVRMLGDLSPSDLTEARALTHALDRVHVYSSSWGPDDDGATFDGPKALAREALRTGSELGRGGLGAIYVWASGNGGAQGDNCNCDGYSASVFTLTVGSASQRLSSPWYAESCPAVLAVTFSSGGDREQQMVSTDLRHQCTMDFSGTSASAPLAAGIAALALEANPGLTWRDLQHAVMWTAQPAPLQHRNREGGTLEWRENSAGHRYHHKMGFGLFNVGALIALVQPASWRRVPDKSEEELRDWKCGTGWDLSQSKSVRCELDVARISNNRIRFLEHVQLMVSLRYSERGALAIYLTSGAGSQSQLLSRRRRDHSDQGLRNWQFQTVHFWGENPEGKWRLTIVDESGNRLNSGRVDDLRLILHGTADMPDHRVRAGGRRRYED